MSNSLILRNLFRAVFLMAVQVLVLAQIHLGGDSFNYITIFIYPLFLMFLPLRTPTWVMLLLGFVYGFCIDIFWNNTLGMHTAACVFSAFTRSGLVRSFEPQGGYKDSASLTRRSMGIFWFFRYAAAFLFIHIFVFFSVEEFTPFYWKKIIFYTIPSYAISLVFSLIYSFLFDPAE
jgi:rod shape-determining protein MreD